MRTLDNIETINTSPNSTYKKLAVQWLNKTLCFVSSFVVTDGLVLRNRQLLVAAKRCAQPISVRKNHLDSIPTFGIFVQTN